MADRLFGLVREASASGGEFLVGRVEAERSARTSWAHVLVGYPAEPVAGISRSRPISSPLGAVPSPVGKRHRILVGTGIAIAHVADLSGIVGDVQIEEVSVYVRLPDMDDLGDRGPPI